MGYGCMVVSYKIPSFLFLTFHFIRCNIDVEVIKLRNADRKDKIKLQVTVSVELCERIDAIAQEIGMDRSQLCAYYIGQQVKQAEMQATVLAQMPDAMKGFLQNAMPVVMKSALPVETKEDGGESK